MQIISHFEPLLEVPFYYPCNMPLVYESLRRKGKACTLSMISGASLYGLPAIGSNGVQQWYNNSDKLGYRKSIWSTEGPVAYHDLEAGLEAIKKCVSAGELFIATGSSYYLPYCDDYLNPVYIEKLTAPNTRLFLVDHWLGVYGMDETHVHVYDPVFSQFKGVILREDFYKFWRGNAGIPELASAKVKGELRAYSSIGVKVEALLSEMTMKEALLTIIATHVEEFLAAKHYRSEELEIYFGRAASGRILAKGAQVLAGDAQVGEVSSMVFDMRWCRYYFRGLLQDAAEHLGERWVDRYAAYCDQFNAYDQAHKRLVATARQRNRQEALQDALSHLRMLMQQEQLFFEQLIRQLARVDRLPRKKGEVSSLSAADDALEFFSYMPHGKQIAAAIEQVAEAQIPYTETRQGHAGQSAATTPAVEQSVAGQEAGSEAGQEAGQVAAKLLVPAGEAEQADKLLRIILDACREINEQFEDAISLELGLQAPLYGKDGRLDSLGLITLLAVIEQELQEEFGLMLQLASEEALASSDKPFGSVSSLHAYITELKGRCEAT